MILHRLFPSWYVCLKWLNGRAPVLKTGELRFKSQFRHKFFSLYLIYTSSTRHAWQCHSRKVFGQMFKMSSRSECKATPCTPASTVKGGWSCRQWLSSCFEGKACKISSSSECRTKPGTSAIRIFKFPKPPRACLQQLVKVSSQ